MTRRAPRTPTPRTPPAGAADRRFMRLAWQQAATSYGEGGLPIGAVMVEGGAVIAAGHNRRVQDGDPTAHGEMDCLAGPAGAPAMTVSACTPP